MPEITAATERILRDAMERLLTGAAIRTDGRLIKENLYREAGVSRATFYLHFSSKESILLEQLREQDGHLMRLYAMLRDLEAPTHEAVRDWLEYYVTAVRAFRGELYLFSLSTVFDDSARSFVVDQRRRVIALLGTRYAAFRVADDDARGWTRCLLLMFELEQIVSALVHGDTMPDENLALDAVTAHLVAFVTADQLSSPS